MPRCLTNTNLNVSYGLIKEMDQLILSKQGLSPRQLICFQRENHERADAVFQADLQGFRVSARVTGGPGIPPFAAVLCMDAGDFVIIGKSMQVTFQKAGVQLKSAQRGTFKANRWIPQGPLSAEPGPDGVGLRLTDAPAKLDVVRLKLKSR